MPKKEKVCLPLSEIAATIGATVRGDASTTVEGLAPFNDATTRDLTLLQGSRVDEVQRRLREVRAGAVLVPTRYADGAGEAPCPVLLVPDPLAAAVALIPLFFDPPPTQSGIHPTAIIDPSAEISADVSVGAYCVIGPLAVIGAGTRLHPHVVVYAGARIGARSVLHSGAVVREDCVVGEESVVQNGAVIGADGFGYVPDRELGLRAVPQVGNVVLGARVDVGANACIDRGTFGSTTVGIGSKIDNLVQIGHNVSIGTHSVLCGQTGVAGSCSLGDRVTLAGAVGVKDHTAIGNDIRLGGGSMVFGDLREPGDYLGYPAQPALDWKRQMATLKRLSKIVKKLTALIPNGEND